MIIYPKNPTTQTTNWEALKQDLYETFVMTKKMKYNDIYSLGTEIFTLENDYIWIKIYQSLMIKVGSNQAGIELNNYMPLINKIKKIISTHYENTY